MGSGDKKKLRLFGRAERQRYEAGESSQVRQVAALPWRWSVDGEVEVLLITSRETGRWLIPKGGRMIGRTAHSAAAAEAEEEAGVLGRISRSSVGAFRYLKRMPAGDRIMEADVFPLQVRKELRRWKERGQRQRLWVSLPDAVRLVGDADLARLLREFSEATPGISYPID